MDNEKLKEVQLAVNLAVAYHSGQGIYFKGDLPLPACVRPIEIMKLVWSWGAATPNTLKAAVCKDLLSETDIKKKRLEFVIGEDAAEIVRELTLTIPDNLDKAETNELQDAFLTSIATASIDALVIETASHICTVLDLMNIDHKYAYIHYKQGMVLYDALSLREGEIKAKFGDGVNERICATMFKILLYLEKAKK
jgi:(p)ppGpp synthase/HD superfamily hydrolase